MPPRNEVTIIDVTKRCGSEKMRDSWEAGPPDVTRVVSMKEI